MSTAGLCHSLIWEEDGEDGGEGKVATPEDFLLRWRWEMN